jgi:hypothetical protein
MKTTLYTASDSAFFVGLVVLLNSLALTGNEEELVVLDLGLTEKQTRLLAGIATVVRVPAELSPRHPYLVKPLVHRVQETDVAVWIDSDMMVTRPLRPLIDRAATGAICLFPDPEIERWFPEWEHEFALRAPLRRRPYVNAGFFALSTRHWAGFLDRYGELCDSIPMERTLARGAPKEDPLWASDQDAMNALLMSEVPAEAVHVQSEHEEVHCHVAGDIRVLDERTLEVQNASSRVTLLHQSLLPKPWAADGWKNLQENAYLRLAPRVLFGHDVQLRLDPRVVPVWLRPSYTAPATRRLAIATGRARLVAYSFYHRLPPRVRTPIKATVQRFTSRIR